ncbi:PREDICTED: meteorin-like protein [Galeopterus variegatus]|uniref:Meteorin-like protein n=1 Tax=Galeopterus variegatus TaxID=482537 RepID=A0ABM0SJW6_GALVR|nr:PREDICTED: meteorin-like protein [Galeopterus variegatus]
MPVVAGMRGGLAGRLPLAPTDPCLLPSAVVRGSIQDVTHEPERQESAIHLRVDKLYRQKGRVFQPAPEGDSHWQGHVLTLLECGVRPGHGDFLFTGHMHFGEARLGCAPRFKDFQRMYRDAEERGLNPCEIGAE